MRKIEGRYSQKDQPKEPTLRERRREHTWCAIHKAAVSLVKEKGHRGTTTEEIAELAGISPRTFFNYFATKEDAILGFRAPQITAEILAKDSQREDQHIFNRVTNIMLDMVLATIPTGEYDWFRQLTAQNLVFKESVKKHLGQCADELESFLLTVDWQAFREAGRRGPFPFVLEGREPKEESRRRARASVVIASAILRFQDFSAGLPEMEDREEMIAKSVELFRHLLSED